MGWFIVDGKTSYVLILIILHVLDDMDCKYIQKKYLLPLNVICVSFKYPDYSVEGGLFLLRRITNVYYVFINRN